MERSDGLQLEDGVAVRSGDTQALADVPAGLLESERSGATAKGDALTELAKVMTLEFVFQLGLAGQDDLKELVARSLKIEEQPDFLEGAGLQTLGFIDDEDRGLTGLVAFEQPAIEGEQLVALQGGVAGDAEIVEDEIEKVIRLDARVEDERGGHLLLGEPIEQAAKLHGFARADFAGEEDQALAGANTVDQLLGSGASLLGEEEETRVRVDFEGIF